MEITRIFDFIEYQKKHCPREDAFNQKINGNWVSTSTESFIKQANEVSNGLLELGVKPQDKIALITLTNRTEWSICDLAILQIGAVTVPVYPTISEGDYDYILNHSESQICIVSDEKLYRKIQTIQAKIPSLNEIYSFEKIKGVRNWTEIKKLGFGKKNNKKRQELKSQIKPNDLATIIYTSGTTGIPKGVMLSHNNIVSNVLSCAKQMPEGIDRILSFLLCSHIFERALLYFYQYKCISIYFAEGVDHIRENIREVRPNYMSTVPLLLEKIYDKIVDKGNKLRSFKRILFFWSLKLGHKYEPYRKMGFWYRIQLWIARKLVFVKWKEALGGELIGIACASAALQVRLIRIFGAVGITVMEGYGATETSPVVSMNIMTSSHFKLGSVGKPIENVKVKIANDGEILVKGPNVMLGYYKDPKKTKQAIVDGYYYTGDVGILEDRFLKIIDRKKEMFKTYSGDYVAPQIIENLMKQSRFIEQIMVVGEGEKMPCALVQPDFSFVREWMKIEGLKRSANQLEISNNTKVKEKILEEVQILSSSLIKEVQIKRIALTPDIWSIQEGHLTPTMKLKRKNILQRYKLLYQKMYA